MQLFYSRFLCVCGNVFFFLFLFLFRVILFSFFSWSLVFLVSSLSCIYFFSLYTAVKSPLPLLFLCIGIISLEILSSYGKLLWFGSDFCSCSLYFTNLYIYFFFMVESIML